MHAHAFVFIRQVFIKMFWTNQHYFLLLITLLSYFFYNWPATYVFRNSMKHTAKLTRMQTQLLKITYTSLLMTLI
jgi:hypothetical protein